MQITQYYSDTLPKHLYTILYRLNKRELGMMQRKLVIPNSQDCYYVIENNGTVIGWGLTFEMTTGVQFKSVAGWTSRAIYYYVRATERGKGYGLALAKFVKKIEGPCKSYDSKPFYTMGM